MLKGMSYRGITVLKHKQHSLCEMLHLRLFQGELVLKY